MVKKWDFEDLRNLKCQFNLVVQLGLFGLTAIFLLEICQNK